MRVLHISDYGLPDARIERAAQTAIKSGHQVFFCGALTAGNSVNAGNHKSFSEIRNLEWTTQARLKMPIAWTRLKKHFNKILDDLRPDIIHAHNICAAKLTSESRYPFVFDDHEHLSLELKAVSESDQVHGIKKYISKPLARRIWTAWEKELAQKVPIITIGKNIALEYAAHGGRVFVVPNLPNELEIDKEKEPDFTSRPTLSSAYAGVENTLFVSPYRDMTGFVDLFSRYDMGNLTILGMENPNSAPHVKYTGFLQRHWMYNELAKHHIGIVPWKSHWFHSYCNPNKPYEYAHAGLAIMLTDDFTEVISMFDGNCVTFRDYGELVEKLLYLKDHVDERDNLRKKTFAFARENLYWERYEDNITRAYQLA